MRFAGYRPPSARGVKDEYRPINSYKHFLSGVSESSIQQVSVDINKSGDITAVFRLQFVARTTLRISTHRFIQPDRNWAAPARKYDPDMANWPRDQDHVDCIREFPAPTPI